MSDSVTESDEEASNVALETTPTAQLAFTLPTSADTKIHMHLTIHSHSVVLFVTNSGLGTSTAASCASLVYAIPNVREQHAVIVLIRVTDNKQQRDPSAQPLATSLYMRAGSVDFMTRLARILAKKMRKPVYVGGDVRFWAQEDESEALRGVLDTVRAALQES